MLKALTSCRLAVLASLTVALAGCGGQDVPVAFGPSVGVLPALITGGAELLPAPSELLEQSDAVPRTPSAFPEEDRIKHGKDYDELLPNRNVADSGNNAEFQTHWAEGPGMTPANLGIAIYQFEVPGYDMAPEVHYGWDDAPVDIGTAWLGLGDFDTDRWHWFQCEESGTASVPAMAPYLSPAAHVFVAIVIANEGTSLLRFVHLGPPLVSAVLEADPQQGFVSLPVSFDASSSATSAGTIDEYAWDFDGDGAYDDAGPGDTSSHSYTAAGSFDAAVRATNNYGESATASVPIAVAEPWEHSWGLSDYEQFLDCAVDGAGNIYATGAIHTPDIDYEGDLLLARYSPQGELLWVRRWHQAVGVAGGEGSVGQAIHCFEDGMIYVTGLVDNRDTEVGSALLQQWTPDGTLNWSKAWGGPTESWSIGYQLLMRSDDIYVAGCNKTPAGDYDALLARFNVSGTLDWVVTYAGPDWELISDACFTGLLGESGVALCGMTRSFGAQGEDVLLLIFDLEGVLGLQRRWDAPDNQRGQAIVRTSGGTLYLTGEDVSSTGESEVLLLGVDGSGNNILDLTWGTAADEYPLGLLWTEGGELLACGYYTDLPTDPYDALLVLLDTSGVEQGASLYGTTNETRDWFFGIESWAGGQLICGTASSVPNDWTPFTGTVTTPLGFSWAGCSATPVLLDEEESVDVAGTTEDVLGEGVIDTGGGSDDALLILAEWP